jgi:hypothetical protein
MAIQLHRYEAFSSTQHQPTHTKAQDRATSAVPAKAGRYLMPLIAQIAIDKA